MKQLMRRLSRVADSSSNAYGRLRSRSMSSAASSGRSGKHPFRRSVSSVPSGHFPVYVGEEMERFVVNADLLNHPIFVQLLNRSAQEYGYEQKGVLRIPCRVAVFEQT
ncbi:Auxin-responsive protein saur72 [Dionaea muscipula]